MDRTTGYRKSNLNAPALTLVFTGTRRQNKHISPHSHDMAMGGGISWLCPNHAVTMGEAPRGHELDLKN